MQYSTERKFAEIKDQYDPLKPFKEQFYTPLHHGQEAIYFCGNSLGLQPVNTIKYLQTELNDWATYAVEGHFKGTNPWMRYHKILTPGLSALVGAQQEEVVAMGSLTTNLHLLMVSFYRPEGKKMKIMIEGNAFPSDRYAVMSQLRYHGLGEENLVEVLPNEDGVYHIDDFQQAFKSHGDEIATVLIGGVNFNSGQILPMEAITHLAHQYGAIVGLDLAHAVGNVPLELHDWGVDFAAWCSYKYLNSGPGNVGALFVHQRHHNQPEIKRFEGWWGNEESNRFKMEKDFHPSTTVEAWQQSNAPVLSMAAYKASLDIFMEAGLSSLRQKSVELSGYLIFLLQSLLAEKVTILTPENNLERGAQISFKIMGKDKALVDQLLQEGIYIDFREPDIFRASPVPLYNSFKEVHAFVHKLAQII